MTDTNRTSSEDNVPQEDEKNERHYINGRNAALRHTMLHLAHQLGIFSGDDPLVKIAYLYDENQRVRLALRDICEKLGCNDWPDNLDLGDVMEKHLEPALREAFEDWD
jgi:hypothetical protein